MSRYTGQQQFAKRVRIRPPRPRRRFRVRVPRIRVKHYHALRFPGMNRGSLYGTRLYHQPAMLRAPRGSLYSKRSSGLTTFRSGSRLGR